MASLRNSVKRKTHKERSQPAARKRLGLLEKHKDYVLRAKDFHRKKEVTQNLQRKAAFRNPDEFYFKMVNARTKDGVHSVGLSSSSKYTEEQLALMRTQDLSYVVHKYQVEQKKVGRLQESLHGIGDATPSNHMHFRSEEDEGDEDEEGIAGEESQLPDLAEDIAGRSEEPSPSIQQQQESRTAAEPAAAPAISSANDRKRKASYRELGERKSRSEALKKVLVEMAVKKELNKKGRKTKIRAKGGGDNTDAAAAAEEDQEEAGAHAAAGGFRWKRERKR